jgi:hypothetical protein
MKYGIILLGTPGTIVLLPAECALCSVCDFASTDFHAFVGILRSLACAERFGTWHYILGIDIKIFFIHIIR